MRTALIAAAVSALVFSGCGGDGGDGGPAAPTIDDIPVLRSTNGVLDATIVVREASHTYGALVATTASYEGLIPGPTLRVRPGDLVRIRLRNELPPTPIPFTDGPAHDPNTTNLHFHGLHVPPDGVADNVFLEVVPGTELDYELTIPADHPAGFFWYHPHFHGFVARQVGGGMTGAIVIEGALDQVPEIAAARERILVLNELVLDATGHVPAPHGSDPTTTTLLVSGLLEPAIDMRPGEVQRWRIVAANGDRFFLLEVEGHQVHQIAKDGFPFVAPVAQDAILLLPGERIEVLVQAGAAGTYPFKALFYDRGGVHPPAQEALLANVVVAGGAVAGTLPATLVAPPPDAQGPIAVQRFFDFDQIAPEPDPVFTVSGQPFDPNVSVASPVLGTTEEWLIVDVMNEEHPFHLHTHPFQVVEVNGFPVAAPRWQDTALVPAQGFIVVRIPFRDFTGRSVFHCHILEHEDHGMMAAFDTLP